MKILVLEDNINLLELIQEELEEQGFEVVCFKDGLDALENCIGGFDCFVLDINVPNMDGLTLLKEIRARDKSTPAIIISANFELENLKKAYTHGCNDFLKKPFYMYELETKIKQWCHLEETKRLIDGFTYDIQTNTLFNADKEAIKLTKKERRFLSLLIKNQNRMTSLEYIEDYVWEGESNTSAGLRSMVKRLRAKLPEGMIVSHHFGYEIKTY
ncbi:response regulator transcription factor [Candidatus Marinarcus aquaticus]|uniref:DNA-binding response regulator n=1 Tax=Candidatus Marinarcus aquaticus TaxID=2044504 RepID=A0A4Q0XUR2_9BACT|nr:response regulator transcription factor [Candidatus Marinarcus aquaticus]RXJ58191.1 DNA-binding response regulator [Candidatus Marinarcus aquaticus]